MAVIVYVEDNPDVRKAVSRVLASVTGLTVLQAESVQELRALDLCPGTVLVTDGDVGDGSCGDVIDHVLSVLGPSGIGGTLLLLSGDQPPAWSAQLLAAEQKGVTTERLVKPSSAAALRLWWSKVRINFGL